MKSTAPGGASTGIGAEVLVPTPRVTAGGHASLPEDTLARVKPLLPRVPITRVYNAAPLDKIGLPVFIAVTPMAQDLTVHAGKGPDALAARLSAIMEAFERTCAETLPAERVLTTSYRELIAAEGPRAVIDPAEFDLPFQTTYDPDGPFAWVQCYDLLQKRHYYVLRDLVISPAREGVCIGVETNGLASGNTYVEAIVHGLYEVIERDAVSQEAFYAQHHQPNGSRPRPVVTIDPQSVPAEALLLTERFVKAGIGIAIQDLTHDLGVPVTAAFLVDSNFPGAEGHAITFAGYGASLDPVHALMRALTEAAQSHTGVVLAARDSYEGVRPVPDRQAMLLRRLAILYPSRNIPFEARPRPAHTDLLTELQEILGNLTRAGLQHCLVTELTREILGIPVVRVLVPGLASPYGDSARRPGLRLLRSII